MNNYRICLIAFNFGKLPNYFPLWLESARHNKNIDFILYTDDTDDYAYPNNVIKRLTSLKECKIRAQKLYDFQIVIDRPYKFCDYRPAFGEIFSEDIINYDFWGTIDLDIILGDIESFISAEILNKYDKILTRDHFCLYRNSAKVNSHYRYPQKRGNKIYKEVFTSSEIYAFGERSPFGVYNIWKYNQWKMYDEPIIADLDYSKYHFKISDREDGQILNFLYSDGHLYSIICDNDSITQKEYLYVHLQKRKMLYQGIMPPYFIVPNCFIKCKKENFTVLDIKSMQPHFIVFHDAIRPFERLFLRIEKKIKQNIHMIQNRLK